MRERAKKSPFYVAYMQIGNLRIGNLCMRRKKLCKPSYAYMRIRYGSQVADSADYRGVRWSGFTWCAKLPVRFYAHGMIGVIARLTC